MSTIAVTGADGIAGTLVRPLLRERHTVTLFTRTPISVEEGERNVVGDLADAAALDDALAGAWAGNGTIADALRATQSATVSTLEADGISVASE